MVHVILTHEVQDYSQWKQAFDAGEDLRSSNGVCVNGVYTSVDNQNKITIATTFPSADAARGFLTNPQLQADMQKAGVVGMPQVQILNQM